MPQLVKGGKWVFGWTRVGFDGDLAIPPEAQREYALDEGLVVLFLQGSRSSGGFGIARADRLPERLTGRVLASGRVQAGGRVNLPPETGARPCERLLVVRGSGHALGFAARGRIVMEAQGHPEIAEYGLESPAQGGGLFVMRPIGVIHSPFTAKEQVPIQPTRSQARGRVDVFAEFAEGLQDLEGFSHMILLYVFHHSAGYELRVTPFLDDQLRGLFATRYPRRPNPIGLSVVRLVARRGNELDIEGVDVLDATPLLDIKPYVPDFDAPAETRTGWYESCRGGAPG